MMKRTLFILSVVILLLTSCNSLPDLPLNTPEGNQPTPGLPVITATGEAPTQAEVPVTSGSATPEPLATQPQQPTQPKPLDGEEFAATLAQAIEARDYAALRSVMSDPFTIAYWRSEGNQMPADVAIAELQAGKLGANAAPDVSFDKDLPALLDGSDPLTLFGPQSNAVRAFFVDGVGSEGLDEAIVIISRDPATGRFYTPAMLFAFQGFQPSTGGQQPDEALDQQLAQAIEARDFDTLRSLMNGQFAFATFNTTLTVVPSDEGIQRLRESSLVQGAQPAVRWGTDVPALLSGADPLGLWGPNAQPVRALHVMGLGKNATEEAVLIIGQDAATGARYFHGILLPQFGYFQAADSDPNVIPTNVRQVTAKEALNVRSGPGMNYAVEGQVRAGETAQVTGKSIDAAWWRISCTQDSSGHCWISADPTLTEVTVTQ